MTKAVSIIGAGGHTRSLLELLESCGKQIEGIYDDSYQPGERELIGRYELTGALASLSATETLVLAIGDNQRRAEFFHQYRQQLLEDNLLHRLADCARDVQLGVANQLFANVFVNAQAKLGNNNIINSGAIIEHETEVGSHNHISVGAILCGRVTVGSHCMIGAGATVIDKVSVCDRVIVGANSTVVSSIDRPGVYVGSPARRVK